MRSAGLAGGCVIVISFLCRCRLQLVCEEWLHILDPDNHLAWDHISIALSDLSLLFVDWLAKRAGSVRNFSAPLAWSANDQKALQSMYRLLFILETEASALKSLRLAMPDKHSAVMHEQVDALHPSRWVLRMRSFFESEQVYIVELVNLQSIVLLLLKTQLQPSVGVKTNWSSCIT